MRKNTEKGITLIALVVTIVVLLILAGISIAMLTGENGVISQARNAKEATDQAKVEELVSVAIGSVISKNNGSTAGITPKMIADQINEDEKRSDVYAENETTFPTYIIFPKEKRKAEANLSVKKEYADNATYDADVNEDDIAPKDLFDYEIINDGSTADLTLDNLPTKTVRITRIKPEFCNGYGYNPDTKENDYEDTNYEILYNGKKIDDTLVIPYQVDGKYVPNGIEGEFYKVTEACIYLSISQKSKELPKVKKIIFPNAITKITGSTTSKNNTIKEIVLPQNIQNIDAGAFKECEALENITIPESVTSIGEHAFYDCKSLTKIAIPEGVTNISESAFERCTNLASITIPDKVTNIENNAFRECNALTSIIIPDSVTNIGEYAFCQCSGLKNITIGNGITSIERTVFLWSSSIESVVIGDNLTNVSYETFGSGSCLNSIKVSERNSKYDSRENCNAIIETESNKLIRGCGSTIIPNGITSIENKAFYECNNLNSIIIPDSVTNIGEYSFAGCSSLTGIIIPNNVTNIGDYAFENCENLNSIKVLEGNSKYDSRENCNAIIHTVTNQIVQGCNTTVIPESVTGILYNAFYGSGISNITIPSNITYIGLQAFENCKNLKSIIIPDSVKSLGAYVFDSCTNLESIIISEGITKLERGTFEFCYNLKTVTMGKEVTSIDKNNFYKCNNLTTINYTGAKEDWSKITIESGNDNLQNATINYNYTK